MQESLVSCLKVFFVREENKGDSNFRFHTIFLKSLVTVLASCKRH
jgi:hypothetical protein